MGRTGRIYRRVRAQLVGRPAHFSWVIEGRLAASGLPLSAAQLRWLEMNGVSSVLTLTESPLPNEWFEGTKLHSKHIAMTDHAPPDPEKLMAAADYIDLQLREDHPLLVHCLGGKGRTACCITAYMVAYRGKSAHDAIESLRRLRPGSVEATQERAIYDLEKRVREARR